MQPAIREKLERCSSLPSLPAVAVEILELCRGDDARRLGLAIGRDPALAAKLIKMANSPLFAFHGEVTTINTAAFLLGSNAVRTLVLSFSLLQGRKKSDAAALNRYWRRSLLGAIAAREIAQPCGSNEEEAFLASLLQDIGVLALARAVGAPYSRLLEQAEGGHDDLCELERSAYGADHAEIGEWLLRRWGTPGVLATVVGASHQPDKLPLPEHAPARNLAEVTHLSGRFADLWCAEAKTAAQRLDATIKNRWPVNTVNVEAVNARLVSSAPELAKLFEIPITAEEMSEILEAAQETLVTLSVQSSQEAREIHDAMARLETRTASLLAEAQRDPLTGAANRGHMDGLIEEAFGEARGTGAAHGVIFIDIDHFKVINDCHGHAVGDTVLAGVVQRILSALRRDDVLGRYGGEEFVLLVRNCTTAELAIVAERIRRAVDGEPFETRQAGLIRATVSLGSALLNRARHQTAADWVSEADTAMYAAKRAGRNRHVAAQGLVGEPGAVCSLVSNTVA